MQFVRLSILTGLCSLAYPQIPDTFENLKVIPKDVTRTQLVRQMRNMAGDLGVRCNYCHVGESEDNLIGYDFATDEKREKKTARDMMKLVNELNGGFFAERDGKLSCETCHHGLPKPQTLTDVLLAAVKEHGIETGIAEYRQLRDRYYGSFSYDFSARALPRVARRLAQIQRAEDAYKLHQLNLEFHPNHAQSLAMIASHLVITEQGMEAAHPFFLKAMASDSAATSFIMNGLAFRLQGKKRADEGIEVLQLLTATAPDYANGFDSLGEFLAAAGRSQEAISAYERALSIDPTFESSQNALQKLRAEQPDP